ncbi:BT_3928 family protein [Eisenibacter elegans]|jgi:hypothetical protein|uniref:BT_3928 family protein n=1 Tax=Eisenibacter elegans TaxID=997 RepID=UPI0004115992|nr:BT_3928 family protein [Eisenibacter elegans]
MHIFNKLLAFFVGGVFVLSGLVKLNDPQGTQIKLEEYFHVFQADQTIGLASMSGLWEFLLPYSLSLAVLLSTAEVVLGANLIFSYRQRSSLMALLALIIFFGMLTFYSAYFNKVTDCGCFGDAIKLTPWQSFWKDMLLLMMVTFLLIQYSSPQRALKDQMPKLIGWLSSTAVLVASLILAYYAIHYLPPIDFRAYKIGNSIPEQMKPSEPLRYEYLMEKDGKTHRFTDYPSDTTYVYKDMRLLNPKAQPKITDYAIWNNQGDITQESFKGRKLFIVIADIETVHLRYISEINELAKQAKKNKITPMVLTGTDDQSYQAFQRRVGLKIPYYFADKTVLKTMIRANPGIVLLDNGVVKGKWHHNRLPSVEVLQKL